MSQGHSTEQAGHEDWEQQQLALQHSHESSERLDPNTGEYGVYNSSDIAPVYNQYDPPPFHPQENPSFSPYRDSDHLFPNSMQEVGPIYSAQPSPMVPSSSHWHQSRNPTVNHEFSFPSPFPPDPSALPSDSISPQRELSEWFSMEQQDLFGQSQSSCAFTQSNIVESAPPYLESGHSRQPYYAESLSLPGDGGYPTDSSIFTGRRHSIAVSYPLVSELSSPALSSYSLASSSTFDSPRSASPIELPSENKICTNCQATNTPLWRRDPISHHLLCNACGLYLQQRQKHRPKELIDADNDKPLPEDLDPNFKGAECSHCHTRQTSVWRRSKHGKQLCNACGVYARLKGRDRPLNLKRNRIKPRTKHLMK